MQFRDRGSSMDDRRRVVSAFNVALVLLVVFALAAAGGIAQALPVHSSQPSEIIGFETDLSTPLTLLPSNPGGPFDAYVSPNGVWPLDLHAGETSIEAEEVPLSERMASGTTSTLIPSDISPLGVTMYLSGPSSVYEGDEVTLTVGVTATSSFSCCISGYVYAGMESDTATPGVDYFDNYRKSFSFSEPGQESFHIPTYEDDVVEPDEYFTVVVATYAHSSYTIVPIYSKAWILNDDSVSASGLSVGDATVTEGDAGTTMANFTVSLAPASASTVTVDYSTCGVGCDSAATATGGDDYEIAVDSLTFAPGETSKTIPVTINGDTVVEPDETFFMNIGNATGATVTDSRGQGTILDDDTTAANVAPVVSAGSNQTVTLPSSAALNGTVTDDGLPSGSLSSTWTKQSGPGTVAFGNTHAVDTTAGFSTDGVYVLRLTATDGALSNSDDVKITVDPLPPIDYFIDDDDSVFEADINWMAAVGITMGCNPPTNNRFCPDSNVTRGQMAAFLVRALNLTERLDDPFTDDDDSVFEADIERLAAAGITKGCNPPANDRFCPDAKVTRAQMAAFLVRALGYTDDGGGDLFVDDDDSIFEADIDRLGTAGVTKGCNPPTNDRFCPDANVTRGQMAAFLHRALE